MTDNHLRNLRRLTKRYHIRFSLPAEPWPECHADNYNNIVELGSYKFATYAQNANIRTAEEPWTRQTKSRAEWLTSRAGSLFQQDRNEAGWRFGIENDVLRRFSVEVACHKCRARIWQSEIQVPSNKNERYAKQLEERQNSRKACQCPQSKHLYDFYESGTNNLFEDRAEEFVIYDDLLRSELKKQGPDRVYGLKNTGNFDSFLSSSAPPEVANQPGDTIGDVIKHTPFKSNADPLLFPFLILEAKSESSNNGFDAIQTQTAFPIRALLKLQEDLQSSSPIEDPGMAPLVWFLASRGDAWRVYGCHIVPGKDDMPAVYEISLLWSGSLMHKDQALQLVLIVDYIMDWARDIYRIEILTHLKSIVTGQLSDQMSFRDSDMFSTCRSVFNWISPARSTMTENDQESLFVANGDSHFDTQVTSHQSLLNVSIPNAKLGAVRSAQICKFRFECLYITKDSIPSLLQLIGGRNESESRIESTARSLINFVTQFDETLVMSGQNLDLLEFLWTGTSRSNSKVSSEDFFVVIETSWYFNTSWDIQREMSCLAISRSAFTALKKEAKFRVKHKGIENLQNSERVCDEQIIRDGIACLTSGSPWQVLLAAISSTLVTLYPFPLRKRPDFTPAVKTIRFGHIRASRVAIFIRKILLRQMWDAKKRLSNDEMSAAMRAGLTANEAIRMTQPKHKDMPLKRISECQKRITDTQSHVHDHCARCIVSPDQDVPKLGHGYLDRRNEPEVSKHKAVLVVSLKAADASKISGEPDMCVFGLADLSQLRDGNAFATMIDSMTRPESFIFHTIQFSPSHSPTISDEVEHNLPLPYRPPTQKERGRIALWVRELRGSPPESKDEILDYNVEWEHNQQLMFLLSIGHSKGEASRLLKHKPWSSTLHSSYMSRIINVVNKKPVPLDNYNSTIRTKSRIAGDSLVQRFASWQDGRNYLSREYPYQSKLLESIATRKGEGNKSDSARPG